MAVGITSISGPGTPSTDVEVYTENDEEEIDQLDDSDLDEEDELDDDAGGSSSRTRLKQSDERIPGHTLIPTERVENIMHADGSGGHMSKEALFMLSAATEEFIKRLAGAGYRGAAAQRRSVVDYHDVASATIQRPEFVFLQDTIPTPITLSEAMRRRAAKEKEVLEDNPAISVVPPQTTFIPSGPNISYPGTSKPSKASKARQTNGKEKTNGSTSTIGTKRQRDSKGRWSQFGQAEDGASEGGSASGRASSGRVRTRPSRASLDEAAETFPAPANGRTIHGARNHTHTFTMEHTGWVNMAPPLAPPVDMAGSHFARPERQWSPAQYTGPASGYLEDRRILFGRGGMANNPGRTIYSAQRPPAR